MTQTPGYGIWTTDLDGNRVAGFTPAQILAVTQERDELLAALQAAVDLADKNKAVMEASGYMVTRSAEMQAVYDQCAAAIQKASNKEQA